MSPERPDVQVLAGVPGARYEPLECGWLTYQLGGQWLDLEAEGRRLALRFYRDMALAAMWVLAMAVLFAAFLSIARLGR